MTQLDFTPRGVASTGFTQVLRHAGTEASLVARNIEQVILALVIPVAILFGGSVLPGRLGQAFEVTAPSVMALAVWSTCFTSLAITTGFERRYNVLERLAVTPLGRSRLVLGKALAFALITGAQLLALLVIAGLLGWRPSLDPVHLLLALGSAILAMGAFAGLGLALAGTARPEITLGAANLIYLVGMLGGALLVPLSRYPGWTQPMVAALPTAALGEAFRSGAWWAPLSLVVWCAAALLLARKVFRWTS